MPHNSQHATSESNYQVIGSGKLDELYFLYLSPSPCSLKVVKSLTQIYIMVNN